MQKAPWSAELIAALNEQQLNTHRHPYTCGNDSRHRDLRATPNGWVCDDCDYTQDWCHQMETKCPT